MEKLIAGANKLGLQFSSRQLEQFDIYYREMMDWNRRMNLTAITSYEGVQIKHFLDSITITLAISCPVSGVSLNVIDVGTGAGLPGIPLKILFPDVRLVLLEATAKKAAFLNRVISELGLDNTEVVVGRAETVARESRYREQFDIVLSRAVAALPTLIELTMPFCAIGGSFIAQKKGDIEPEIRQANRAIAVLGGSLREIKRIELEEFTDERCLIVIDKVSPTPTQYPRRAGIPSKRPLLP